MQDVYIDIYDIMPYRMPAAVLLCNGNDVTILSGFHSLLEI
jgi:hypothetical protein